MWFRDEDEMPTEIHEWKQESWEDRVKAFLQTEDTPTRFDWPFPMGVFGTLREGHGNNRLMHRADISKYRLAFLPHFYASGLSVGHRKNSTAPFEVFYYKPEEFVKMIQRVDGLESFSPQHCHGSGNNGYYYRTLVWLHLLPEGYVDRWFPQGRSPDLWEDRNMEIPPKNWATYEKVPCWVYSNMRATIEVAKEVNHPIIWPTGAKCQKE